jgi:hypothetical protein
MNLLSWIHNLNIKIYVKHNDQSIVNVYAQVLQFLQNSPNYNVKALRESSESHVADSWFIAFALVHNFTIVTFERPVGKSIGNIISRPKIPDIATHFNIQTINIFQMMRVLDLTL